ncbi:hypothetical protein [Fimbriiglobus ruber]|uniref:Uncharacterized protein n=1 Tax=Fimbriiglobus ruber TaxID=1908690 RepID=A0A225D5N1_9BACT|nr:hypothetical protein [Fimbriiglobus ruber]OWK34944.1 hypothetical protein FRUB_09786 [Fimbriiglobus ruber]
MATNFDQDAVKAMVAQGMFIQDIARSLGVPVWRVRAVVIKNKLSYAHNIRRLSPERVREMVEQGMTTRAIMAATGFCQASVLRARRLANCVATVKETAAHLPAVGRERTERYKRMVARTAEAFGLPTDLHLIEIKILVCLSHGPMLMRELRAEIGIRRQAKCGVAGDRDMRISPLKRLAKRGLLIPLVGQRIPRIYLPTLTLLNLFASHVPSETHAMSSPERPDPRPVVSLTSGDETFETVHQRSLVLRGRVLSKFTPEVFDQMTDALIERCRDGDLKAIGMAYKLYGLDTPVDHSDTTTPLVTVEIHSHPDEQTARQAIAESVVTTPESAPRPTTLRERRLAAAKVLAANNGKPMRQKRIVEKAGILHKHGAEVLACDFFEEGESGFLLTHKGRAFAMAEG